MKSYRQRIIFLLQYVLILLYNGLAFVVVCISKLKCIIAVEFAYFRILVKGLKGVLSLQIRIILDVFFHEML